MQTPQFLHPLDSLPALPTAPLVQPLSPTGGAGPPFRTLIGFLIEAQLQDEWCWAAVSVMVAKYYGTTRWSQCALAADELGLDCCGADGPVKGNSGCDRPWFLDAPLARVGHFDRISWAAEAFASIQGEINASRPLCARIAWNGGSAHFVALTGWSVDSAGTEFVDAYDPYYGFSQMSYNDFLTAYQSPGDSWTHSYFTIASMSPVAGSPAPAANSPKSA
jgi:hypothetical protein